MASLAAAHIPEGRTGGKRICRIGLPRRLRRRRLAAKVDRAHRDAPGGRRGGDLRQASADALLVDVDRRLQPPSANRARPPESTNEAAGSGNWGGQPRLARNAWLLSAALPRMPPTRTRPPRDLAEPDHRSRRRRLATVSSSRSATRPVRRPELAGCAGAAVPGSLHRRRRSTQLTEPHRTSVANWSSRRSRTRKTYGPYKTAASVNVRLVDAEGPAPQRRGTPELDTSASLTNISSLRRRGEPTQLATSRADARPRGMTRRPPP